MPAVSVLMAVYNGERHLAAAIDSILAQTFRDFELVIVDDGSTDGSRVSAPRPARSSRGRMPTTWCDVLHRHPFANLPDRLVRSACTAARSSDRSIAGKTTPIGCSTPSCSVTPGRTMYAHVLRRHPALRGHLSWGRALALAVLGKEGRGQLSELRRRLTGAGWAT